MCRGGGSKLGCVRGSNLRAEYCGCARNTITILIVVLVLSVLPSTNSYVDIVWSRVCHIRLQQLQRRKELREERRQYKKEFYSYHIIIILLLRQA